MQKRIDFNKKEVKCIRIFQDLKKMVQDSQKYIQKGHFESWAQPGSWNSFYDKRNIFPKKLIWHRSFQQEAAGSWWKMAFPFPVSGLTLHLCHIFYVSLHGAVVELSFSNLKVMSSSPLQGNILLFIFSYFLANCNK